MRYLIKEKIFSFSDSFDIMDENQDPIYRVVGQILSLGNKLTLYSLDGRELLRIEERLMSFLPKYEIFAGSKLLARINKELSFFRPSFNIESVDGEFRLEGDFFEYNFNILKDGREIASISKALLSFSDSYTVDVDQDVDQTFILALVIIVDQILHDDNN